MLISLPRRQDESESDRLRHLYTIPRRHEMTNIPDKHTPTTERTPHDPEIAQQPHFQFSTTIDTYQNTHPRTQGTANSGPASAHDSNHTCVKTLSPRSGKRPILKIQPTINNTLRKSAARRGKTTRLRCYAPADYHNEC